MKFTVKIEPSAIADNQPVKSEVHRNGRIQDFDDKQEAERWLDSLQEISRKELTFRKSNNMSSRGPDVRLVTDNNITEQFRL